MYRAGSTVSYTHLDLGSTLCGLAGLFGLGTDGGQRFTQGALDVYKRQEIQQKALGNGFIHDKIPLS